ncbi:putative epoxide hydrolase [Mycena floridula]|nr:putative epoxide hydrolase [Mycena floridula]
MPHMSKVDCIGWCQGYRCQTPRLLLLLHGFPEMAHSWRKVMIPLSTAGYHVVAPDQRGYGQTRAELASEPVQYDDDIAPYRPLNLATDVVSLVHTLGYETVQAVVGHDFGSRIAGLCALIRPDMFKAAVMMSAPFTGPPSVGSTNQQALTIAKQLSELSPPRKHYTMYFSTAEANLHMRQPPEGLQTFLRNYFYSKSADSSENEPHPLGGPSAAAIAVMPHYYIMLESETMPQAVMGTLESQSGLQWLPDDELEVYVAEYTRTGFQGGLNWYRAAIDPKLSNDLLVFAGKRVEVPAMFIAGKQDWGTYQHPGAAEVMQKICTQMTEKDFVLIEGAGHWVQQEKSTEVVELLLRFLEKVH